MVSMFDDSPRTDSSKIRSDETRLDWLNRAARPECEAGRRALNAFFASLTPEQQRRFQRRIESDRDHDNVIAEAYAFLVFEQLGFKVDYEPSLGTRSSPDLLISDDGSFFAVDVTVDGGLGAFNRQQNRVNRLLEQIEERIRTVGFAFAVRDCKQGESNPSPARLARQIQELADGVDHATLVALGPCLPEYDIEDSSTGWCLTLSPIPFKDGSQVPNSPFGMTTSGTWSGDCVGDVKAKVLEKLSQHHDLPYPLLVFVAFNDLMTRPDHNDVVSALYGTTCETRSGEVVKAMRARDGVWTDERERPLAVVTCVNIFGWNMLNRDLTLWKNPTLESIALHRRWKFRMEGRPSEPPMRS